MLCECCQLPIYPIVVTEDYCFNQHDCCLEIGDIKIVFTPKEAEMFACLLTREDKICKDQWLWSYVWGDLLDPPDLEITKQYIYRIRKKLKNTIFEIRNEFGVGYKLTFKPPV